MANNIIVMGLTLWCATFAVFASLAVGAPLEQPPTQNHQATTTPLVVALEGSGRSLLPISFKRIARQLAGKLKLTHISLTPAATVAALKRNARQLAPTEKALGQAKVDAIQNMTNAELIATMKMPGITVNETLAAMQDSQPSSSSLDAKESVAEQQAQSSTETSSTETTKPESELPPSTTAQTESVESSTARATTAAAPTTTAQTESVESSTTGATKAAAPTTTNADLEAALEDATLQGSEQAKTTTDAATSTESSSATSVSTVQAETEEPTEKPQTLREKRGKSKNVPKVESEVDLQAVLRVLKDDSDVLNEEPAAVGTVDAIDAIVNEINSKAAKTIAATAAAAAAGKSQAKAAPRSTTSPPMEGPGFGENGAPISADELTITNNRESAAPARLQQQTPPRFRPRPTPASFPALPTQPPATTSTTTEGPGFGFNGAAFGSTDDNDKHQNEEIITINRQSQPAAFSTPAFTNIAAASIPPPAKQFSNTPAFTSVTTAFQTFPPFSTGNNVNSQSNFNSFSTTTAPLSPLISFATNSRGTTNLSPPNVNFGNLPPFEAGKIRPISSVSAVTPFASSQSKKIVSAQFAPLISGSTSSGTRFTSGLTGGNGFSSRPSAFPLGTASDKNVFESGKFSTSNRNIASSGGSLSGTTNIGGGSNSQPFSNNNLSQQFNAAPSANVANSNSQLATSLFNFFPSKQQTSLSSLPSGSQKNSQSTSSFSNSGSTQTNSNAAASALQFLSSTTLSASQPKVATTVVALPGGSIKTGSPSVFSGTLLAIAEAINKAALAKYNRLHSSSPFPAVSSPLTSLSSQLSTEPKTQQNFGSTRVSSNNIRLAPSSFPNAGTKDAANNVRNSFRVNNNFGLNTKTLPFAQQQTSSRPPNSVLFDNVPSQFTNRISNVFVRSLNGTRFSHAADNSGLSLLNSQNDGNSASSSGSLQQALSNSNSESDGGFRSASGNSFSIPTNSEAQLAAASNPPDSSISSAQLFAGADTRSLEEPYGSLDNKDTKVDEQVVMLPATEETVPAKQQEFNHRYPDENKSNMVETNKEINTYTVQKHRVNVNNLITHNDYKLINVNTDYITNVKRVDHPHKLTEVLVTLQTRHVPKVVVKQTRTDKVNELSPQQVPTEEVVQNVRELPPIIEKPVVERIGYDEKQQ